MTFVNGSKYLAIVPLILVYLLLGSSTLNSTCNVTTGACSGGANGTLTTTIISNSTNKIGKTIYVALAYAPGCPHCKALNDYIGNLSKTYDIRVVYINAIANQTIFSQYLKYYNVSESYWDSVPMLFINNTYCVGDTSCISFLSSNIASISLTGALLPNVGSASLGKLTILEITGLALVDSINPCAFAVLIFLLSTLFMRNPNKRYKILLGGISFALGIFVFYATVGVMLLLGIKSALAITNLKNVYIYGAFGIFSIILGLLNLKDYFSYGSLGFVMEVPKRWRPKMLATIDKIMMSEIASIPGAFIAGVLVTAFLLPCITGPYFVAGSLLKDLPVGVGILWLLYYNFLFVLPMFIITSLVYLSFTSVEKAHAFREKNIRRLHLIAGILLLAVGAVILSSIL
jgi:thiol-disulfide isomerase/thioredoxin